MIIIYLACVGEHWHLRMLCWYIHHGPPKQEPSLALGLTGLSLPSEALNPREHAFLPNTVITYKSTFSNKTLTLNLNKIYFSFYFLLKKDHWSENVYSNWLLLSWSPVHCIYYISEVGAGVLLSILYRPCSSMYAISFIHFLLVWEAWCLGGTCVTRCMCRGHRAASQFFLSLYMASRIKLRPPGLSGKHLYLLNHP